MPALSSSVINEKLNFSSTNSFEELHPAIKLEHKPIPSSLLTVTTAFNINEPSLSLTHKLNTPNSSTDNHTGTSSIPSQQPLNNTPKPPVLKSILKQPSFSSSPSTSHEIRKAVHIVSTDSSSEPIATRTVASFEKEKPADLPTSNKTNSQSIVTKVCVSKPIVTAKPTVKPVKRTLPTSVLIKASKPEIKRHEVNKPSSESKAVSPKTKTIPSKDETLKSRQPKVEKEPLVPNIKKLHSKPVQDATKTSKKSENETAKSIAKQKQATCMYDRIKERARNRYHQFDFISPQASFFIILIVWHQ